MSTLPVSDPTCTDPSATDRSGAIELVIEGRPRGVDSIVVARLLPSPRRRMVGPFAFIDHMGPIELAPGIGFDVRPHPHIGLSTVTYFLAGENVHRDSLGNVRHNRPGDINLMTAGRGVVHSERADPEFRATGGAMHGLQIWLALPEANEDDAPSFEHHPQATLPAVAPAPGVTGRVLLGAAFGQRSPIIHPSQPMLVDLELAAGSRLTLPADVAERGVAVIAGDVTAGGQPVATNALAVLCAGAAVEVSATAAARVFLFGGPSLGQRFIEWNFVSSSKEKIAAAKRGWRARTFPAIPGDDQEFIPLPEDSH